MGTGIATVALRGAGGGAIRYGVIVWLVTVLTGLAIWAARHAAVPHISFIIVATTMSGLLLLGWRAAGRLVAAVGPNPSPLCDALPVAKAGLAGLG